MKTRLRILIGVNLCLAGGLLFALLAGQRRPTESRTPAIAASRPLTTEASAAVPAQPEAPAEPKPFCWSQLEANDYHVYVKNLRSIGCPEPTLRAIVTADVEAAYQVRSAGLEGKIKAFLESSWTNQLAAPGTADALKAELQQIPGEEIAEINELLGLQPAPVQVAAAAAAPAPPHRAPVSANQPPSMPYVLQTVDLTALNLDPDQQQVIANLRQDFLDRIGGTNQDPSDPAYLARWQKAQAYEDSMLQGMLGSAVYTKFQMLQISAENKGASGQ